MSGIYGDVTMWRGCIFNTKDFPQRYLCRQQCGIRERISTLLVFSPEEVRGTIQLPARHYICSHYLRGIMVKRGSQRNRQMLLRNTWLEITSWPIITWPLQSAILVAKAQRNLTEPFQFSRWFALHVHHVWRGH